MGSMIPEVFSSLSDPVKAARGRITHPTPVSGSNPIQGGLAGPSDPEADTGGTGHLGTLSLWDPSQCCSLELLLVPRVLLSIPTPQNRRHHAAENIRACHHHQGGLQTKIQAQKPCLTTPEPTRYHSLPPAPVCF